ncbi:putative vesicle tethering protein [Phytophthora cinnamomi]|uniref:putative vesicle tethering protein n=1 Tax=Phytophthora cinnamomi TaxID=4785 RepID=UPI00355AC975|nr:putative vesicle tethering protein [Phytophthora cinnamomi]
MQAVLSRVHRIVVPEEPATSPAPGAARAEAPECAPAPTSPPPSGARPVSPEARADIALAVDRLQFATLLGERKRSIDALQALVQRFGASRGADPTVEEQELGRAAVPAVLAALVSDPRDTELMEAMLELLQAVVGRAPAAALLLLEPPAGAAPWGMQTCLSLLQDPSPWIRGPAVALVRALQDAQPGAFATAVLACKEGLRRLLEVVQDRREHIRDAALAVLGQLTGRDKNAQQFVAFEDGFATLFQIMEAEGLAETAAGPPSGVMADCLHIVNNMVRDNVMTQTLFLEMPYLESHVPRLLRLIGVDGGDEEEEDAAALNRRKRVLKLALQLVRFLVAGLYEGARDGSVDEMAQRDRERKAQELPRIQSLVARQEALMGAVGELACCRSDALTDLRLQALDLLRLVTEHNGGAQMILVNLYASPSGRNVLAELVNLDVGNESDESPVAAASSALLDSLFRENEGARMAVLQHIQSAPPPPVSAGGDGLGGEFDAFSAPPSAGRVLLDAFMRNTEFIVQCSDNGDTEALNNKLVVAWKASHRLAGLLSNSSYCKELALRVPAEYADEDARAVAGGLFLSRCLRLLRSSVEDELSAALQSIVFQAKLSVLLLLIRWCHGCPKAVREIVGSVTNLSVLVDSLSEDQPSTSTRSASEVTQLRGLIALLLGCCLEFLCEDEEEQALKIASTALSPVVADEEQGLQMTRDQLLQMISKRVGLERFTDALVKFQQTSAMIACARATKAQSSRTLLAYRATYDISAEDAEGSSGDMEAHYLFLLYERSFTAFYREMAEQIQKRVIAIYTGVDRGSAPQSGVETGAPSAMGAYQDLIRMQDKQIHDLQRQVEELKQRVADRECGNNGSTTDQGHDNKLLEKLSTQREQFEREKADFERQIKSMSESSLEMEIRVSGLTMAYEQLEREHQQRGQELAVVRSGTTGAPSTLAPSIGLEEQIALLQAELDAERETNRQLRKGATTAKSGDAASQARREKNDADLANVRLMNQLEEMRVENEHKDEQVAERNQMLETLTEGQALMKQDNERLKAQLAEALSRTSQAGDAEASEFKRVVDSLMDDKARLEHRVDELEAAARAAYEKDQEVLRQRIQEVEEARRASPPVSVDCVALETALSNNEVLNNEASVSEASHEVNEDQRLKELVSTQLEELKELRALVVEMETVAIEREAQVQQASFLQELVAGYDVQSRRDKEKFEATVRELEDELARAFLEQKDAGRKSKAAVKELENEVARLFLAKVELEKELAAHHQGEGGSHGENGEVLSANGSFRKSIESTIPLSTICWC